MLSNTSTLLQLTEAIVDAASVWRAVENNFSLRRTPARLYALQHVVWVLTLGDTLCKRLFDNDATLGRHRTRQNVHRAVILSSRARMYRVALEHTNDS